MMKKILLIISSLLMSFSFMANATSVRADDLIIQDDGDIEIIITNNTVLGASTSLSEHDKTPTTESNPPQIQNNQTQHTQDTHQSTPVPISHPVPQAPEKIVPLVPPHTESTVEINPPINDDKKVQVIITTQATNPPSQNTQNTGLKNQSSPNPSPTPITKNVAQVVAQGANGKPVIMITSEKAHQLTIQQGSTKVSTTLPLQIDTLTHSISIPSPKQSATINVLPSEALQGILDNNMLNPQSLSKATINLTNDKNGINYTVSSQKQGKLFGIYPVASPVQVKLSAQNGKVVKASQSVLFSILGWLIK